MHRKMRAAAVVGATVALFAAACGSGGNSPESASGDSGNTQAKDITVWLMNGSAPDAVIKRVNAQFNQAHPNTQVKIQIQQWDGIQEKTTTALSVDTIQTVQNTSARGMRSTDPGSATRSINTNVW